MEYPTMKKVGVLQNNATFSDLRKANIEEFQNTKDFMDELRKYRKTVVLKDNYAGYMKTEKEIEQMCKPRKKTFGEAFCSLFGGWWAGDEL